MARARKNWGLDPAFVACILLAIAGALSLPACMPTYPKEELPEAVKTVCKEEYGMDVDVSVTGQTIGIYYPMTGLLDVSLSISKEAWDEISNLILVASRVVLSTDADIKFYCVITQDVRLPELQVVIIKYVDDVKRGMYRNISRNESFKRTLFSLNLTPQAKKERSIEKIFNKLGVGDDTRQKVLDEFFRSAPTKLSDVGYWRDKFYLKDVRLPEFLAAQMANRIKIDFRGEEELKSDFTYQNCEGLFIPQDQKGFFLIRFKIGDQTTEGTVKDLRLTKVREILRVVNEVLAGYKFKDFDFVVLEDQLENATLRVDAQDVLGLEKKELSVEEAVQAPSGYFVQQVGTQ